MSPQDRVAKGMAFVPQTKNIFIADGSENLEMGAFLRRDDIEKRGAGARAVPHLKQKRNQAAGKELADSALVVVGEG